MKSFLKKILALVVLSAVFYGVGLVIPGLSLISAFSFGAFLICVNCFLLCFIVSRFLMNNSEFSMGALSLLLVVVGFKLVWVGGAIYLSWRYLAYDLVEMGAGGFVSLLLISAVSQKSSFAQMKKI